MKVFVKLKDLGYVTILHALSGDGLRYQILGLLRKSVFRILVPLNQIFSILIGKKNLLKAINS